MESGRILDIDMFLYVLHIIYYMSAFEKGDKI